MLTPHWDCFCWGNIEKYRPSGIWFWFQLKCLPYFTTEQFCSFTYTNLSFLITKSNPSKHRDMSTVGFRTAIRNSGDSRPSWTTGTHIDLLLLLCVLTMKTWVPPPNPSSFKEVKLTIETLLALPFTTDHSLPCTSCVKWSTNVVSVCNSFLNPTIAMLLKRTCEAMTKTTYLDYKNCHCFECCELLKAFLHFFA